MKQIVRLTIVFALISVICITSVDVATHRNTYDYDDMLGSYDPNQDGASSPAHHKVTHHASFHSEKSDEFDRDAVIMHRIIGIYQSHGTLVASDKQLFKSILIKVQQYVDNLDPRLYNVSLYRKNFLNPYKMWAKYILAKPTVEQEQYQQNIDQVQVTFNRVRDNIDQALGQFNNTVHKMLEGLEGYSTQNKSDFYKELSGAVQTFKNKMKSTHDHTLTDYYSFARAHGQKVNPMDLTPMQHEVASGVQSMIDTALLQVHAMALDLTSLQQTQDFTDQMLDELKKHEGEQADEYNRLLEENKKRTGSSWWVKLKKRGAKLLEIFADKSKDAVRNAATEARNNFMKEHGSEVQGEISSITGKVKDLVPDSLKKK